MHRFVTRYPQLEPQLRQELCDAAIAIGEPEQQPESASDTLWVRGRRRPQPKAVAGAILGLNYQSTEWYQDSFALLTGQGLEMRSLGDNWLSAIYRQMIRGEWL